MTDQQQSFCEWVKNTILLFGGTYTTAVKCAEALAKDFEAEEE